MSRRALLTGTAGGTIGTITGGIGIIWIIIDMLYVIEIGRTMNNLLVILRSFDSPALAFTYASNLTPTAPLFYTFSMILAILLLVGCILTGIGFYGMYKAGGGAVGVVGLAFGIIGGIAGALFLILGNVMPARMFLPPLRLVSITVPAYLFIFIGLAILGTSLIVMGAASIVVRESTARPSYAVTAGVLSIIGGSLLFPYVLTWLLLTIIGDIITLIGFGFMLSVFAIWAAVFYGSQNV